MSKSRGVDVKNGSFFWQTIGGVVPGEGDVSTDTKNVVV